MAKRIFNQSGQGLFYFIATTFMWCCPDYKLAEFDDESYYEADLLGSSLSTIIGFCGRLKSTR